VKAIIDGNWNAPDVQPQHYAFGLELICEALGEEMKQGYGLCGFKSQWLSEDVFEVQDTLWRGEKPLSFPETKEGLPAIYFLPSKLIEKRLPELKQLDLEPRNADVQEAITEFISWLEQAKAKQSNLVIFFY
jgi:hypothetical protein